MPGPEHFGEQFGISKREESRMAGEAMGAHLLDAMAKSQGFQDYEHAQTTKKNIETEQFVNKYGKDNPNLGKTANLRYDKDYYDDVIYEVSHPSGWKGHHVGMHMDLVHPKHGPVDIIDYNDYSRHGLGSPATHEDWPSAEQVHADLDEFVKERGQDYNW